MATKNPQKASEDFSFGSKAWNEYYHGRNKDKKTARKHPKLTPAQVRKSFVAEDDRRNAEAEAEYKGNLKAYGKILGPTLQAQAVKIARINLEPFDFQDVDAFEEEGWKVVGAGTIQARRVYRNPPPLGDGGVARALVLLGPVDVAMLKHLHKAHEVDCFPAPKAYREGIKRNPSGVSRKKVYDKVKSISQAGQAWNALELSNALQIPVDELEPMLGALAKEGLVHSPGSDLFGPVWAAGALQRGLFANPKGAKATKKAKAWNGKESLLTAPKKIKVADSHEFVEVGPIVAIEYESNKFDGTTRVYRHDVTKKRILHLSTDGEVILIKPGFKVTKRGIEG